MFQHIFIRIKLPDFPHETRGCACPAYVLLDFLTTTVKKGHLVNGGLGSGALAWCGAFCRDDALQAPCVNFPLRKHWFLQNLLLHRLDARMFLQRTPHDCGVDKLSALGLCGVDKLSARLFRLSKGRTYYAWVVIHRMPVSENVFSKCAGTLHKV